MSKRTIFLFFVIPCLSILTPDFAALITRSAFRAALADPQSGSGFLNVLAILDIFLGPLAGSSCRSMAADPLLTSGPFCSSFVSLTIALFLVCLGAAAIVAILSPSGITIRRRARHERLIGTACGAAIALFSGFKVYLTCLAYYSTHRAFDGTSVAFCAHYFAIGPFIADTCAPPMAIYAYLSLATLASAMAWWIYYFVAAFRAARRHP